MGQPFTSRILLLLLSRHNRSSFSGHLVQIVLQSCLCLGLALSLAPQPPACPVPCKAWHVHNLASFHRSHESRNDQGKPSLSSLPAGLVVLVAPFLLFLSPLPPLSQVVQSVMCGKCHERPICKLRDAAGERSDESVEEEVCA